MSDSSSDDEIGVRRKAPAAAARGSTRLSSSDEEDGGEVIDAGIFAYKPVAFKGPKRPLAGEGKPGAKGRGGKKRRRQAAALGSDDDDDDDDDDEEVDGARPSRSTSVLVSVDDSDGEGGNRGKDDEDDDDIVIAGLPIQARKPSGFAAPRKKKVAVGGDGDDSGSDVDISEFVNGIDDLSSPATKTDMGGAANSSSASASASKRGGRGRGRGRGKAAAAKAQEEDEEEKEKARIAKIRADLEAARKMRQQLATGEYIDVGDDEEEEEEGAAAASKAAPARRRSGRSSAGRGSKAAAAAAAAEAVNVEEDEEEEDGGGAAAPPPLVDPTKGVRVRVAFYMEGEEDREPVKMTIWSRAYFSKPFGVFAEQRGVEVGSLAFSFNGFPLAPTDKPCYTDGMEMSEEHLNEIRVEDKEEKARREKEAAAKAEAELAAGTGEGGGGGGGEGGGEAGKVMFKLRWGKGEKIVKMRPTDTFQKLYTLVRQRFGSEDVKLVFDGDALDEEDTPEGLDMEDEDLIDVQGI